MSHHKYAKLATFKVAYQTFRDSRPGLRHVMDVDLRGYLTHNLETGARLAAENEVKVHDKNMARTYEFFLIALENFAKREGANAVLWEKQKAVYGGHN